MMTLIDHLSFACSDLARSSAFYDAVLGALGYVRVYSSAKASGWAPPSQEEQFAIKIRDEVVAPGTGFHLAFKAASAAAVDRFYAEALRLGGKDNGVPGLRPHYGPNYYAAFVIDPDGHFLEAVCHAP